MIKHHTREEWLEAAVRELTHTLFAPEGHSVPAVRVSVGWPGGRGNKNHVIGQCWHPGAAADQVAQVFVSPVLDDAARVLDVLVHELCHAIDGNQNGHKAAFARIARAVGLTGKMTATVATPELAQYLTWMVERALGDYPHAALAPGLGTLSTPKQGTRMLKVVCAHEGEATGEDVYTVRMTRKWLDLYGAPICPCHRDQMVEA